MSPSIAVVIPTYRRAERLAACLASVFGSDCSDVSVIVVNDGRCRETSAMLHDRFPAVVELASDRDLWWAGSMNLGIEHARAVGARYCLVLNDDVTVAPDAIGRLLRAAEAADGRIVCAVVVDAQDPRRVWAAGGGLAWPVRGEFHYTDRPAASDRRQVEWSPGMGTLIPMSVFDAIGVFDERNMPQYLADTDLCLRARKAGIATLLCPDSVVYNDTALTGGLPPRGRISVRDALSVYASKKSTEFLRARATFTWRHCPSALFLPTLLIRYARVTAHVARRMMFP